MSLIVSMTSVAILAGVTLSQTALSAVAIAIANGEKPETGKGLETSFMDITILIKTLEEMDCHVTKIDENEILVATTCGNLKYKRADSSEAFKMYIDEITDVDGLLENIKSFELDYGRNVQEYTYNHIKKNLSKEMSIEKEEVLDDNSILLTINVE